MRIVKILFFVLIILAVGVGGWLLVRRHKSEPSNPQGAKSQNLFAQGSSFDPIQEYDKQCVAEEEPSLECAWLQGMVSAEILEALETIEYSRDQRGVSEALEALELEDEPEIQIAACRILGAFPDDPGISSKVPPLLFSPYVEVQRISAQLLSRNTDPALAALGSQWINNHRSVQAETPYDELEIPSHYTQIGFPEYPNAVRFPPADSDRSVGWMTSDSASVVASQLSTQLGVKLIGFQEWYDRQQQAQMKLVQSFDYSAMGEIQKLAEEYAKTQDSKLLEQMEALQKKMAEPAEKANAAAAKSVSEVANPPGGISPDQVQYLIAEERESRVSKLIMVYPEPTIQRTVIQMIWDLSDYDRAWPER